MHRIFASLLIYSTALLSASVSLSAQSSDSTATTKDSVIHHVPIPELGSVEPFGSNGISITAEEITLNDYRSLYDVIGRRPGVFVRDLASPGQPNQLVINGITDRNIAVLVDGVPYNDHYTGSFNLWNIPVEMIERVEFITGSRAAFYDGRSAGGAINIVTKSFFNNRAITKLRYSQGISGYTQTDASFAQNIANGVNLTFALSHHGFGSNKEYQNYRGRFKNSNDDAWMVRSKLRYNVTDWLGLSFSHTYDRSWTGLHGGIDRTASNDIYDGLTASVNNVESYQKLYNSHYNFTAAFYPFQDSTVLTSFTLYAFDRLREYRDEENRSFERNSIFTQRNFNSIGKGIKLNLLSQYSDLRIIGYADLARIQSNDIITAGAKAEFLPGSFISVTPFVTVKDYQSQFIANGGVEAVVRPFAWLEFFGGISRNIIDDRGVSTATPTSPLVPGFFSVSSRSKDVFHIMEAGARLNVPGLEINVTLQRTEQIYPIMFDTITFANSAPYYQPAQYTYDALSTGIHLQWGVFHLEGNGSYLIFPSVQRDNVTLRLFPEITAHGSIYFQGLLAKGALDLKMGLRGMYVSEQTGMSPYDEFGVWMPSAQLRYGRTGSVDLFAVGKIGDAYVHMIWENLTGNQYLLAPVYPMYARNIRFGVSWEFID